MAVLSKEQFEFLERLFYDAPALSRVVRELRSAAITAAEQSADPTARQAVVGITELPEAMGYKRPEAWLQVADATWNKYQGSPAGKAMYRRYIRQEIWTRTCMALFISDHTYYNMRKEFILSAALIAANKGLKF